MIWVVATFEPFGVELKAEMDGSIENMHLRLTEVLPDEWRIIDNASLARMIGRVMDGDFTRFEDLKKLLKENTG